MPKISKQIGSSLLLNQITGRDVPPYLNVIGAASATATNVNVNNTMAYLKGEYYWVELTATNTSTAIWQSVTNRAVQNGTTNSVTGNLFLPKHAEVFGYDADGNLTNDGRWAYVWDGENRLIRQFAPTTAPAGSVKALTYDYDWQGRRIGKTVSNWSGSAWSQVFDETYLYDSWNLLASVSNNAVVQEFLWGSDISGSIQGAGGVGGLLAVNAKSVSVTFAAYDGNGNVASLCNTADGSSLATYEYGPFGEVIRTSGSATKTNPFRFSTKFCDDETDSLYYGSRFLDTRLGRWLSRDRVGEFGRDGGNLYAFVRSRPTGLIDPIGNESFDMFSNEVGIPISPPRYCALIRSFRINPSSSRYGEQYMPEYTQWYESKFPNTASFAQNSFKEKVSGFLKKSCDPQKAFSNPGFTTIDIFGYGTGEQARLGASAITEKEFGDVPQTANEASFVLGNYYFELRDLEITTRLCCGCLFYSWTANVVLVDGLGVDPNNFGVDERDSSSYSWVDLSLYYTGESFFPERKAVIAEWPIAGGGKCCVTNNR